MQKLWSATVLAIGLAGCGAVNTGGNTDDNRPAGLARFASNAELLSYIAEQTSAAVNSRGDMLAGPTDQDSSNGGATAGAPTVAPVPEGGAGMADVVSGPGRSTTTEQEAGVQESDIVKSDADHIYLLSRGTLRVVQAQPATSLSEASSLELGGWGQDLYLTDKQLVALTSPEVNLGAADPAIESFAPIWRPQTDVTIISLSDKSNLNVESRIRLDGYVSSSRVIDDRLYLVVVNYPTYWMDAVGGVLYRTTGDGPDNSDDMLPDVTIEKDGTRVYAGNINEATDIYRPTKPDGLGFTSLVTVPLAAPDQYTAQTLVGYPANVYASTDAIYVTNSDWNFDGKTRETTDIYKFTLTAEGTELAAAGTVPGRVLNQYSMSESKGFLRLATTIGPTWDEQGNQTGDSSNGVYVLAQSGSEFKIASKIEGIEPGESIYAARFLGDKGFLVTFEQIDPLLTLDLSDPNNIRIVGKLEVPGFSTFIVPLDETHLLTIGQNTAQSDWGGVVAEGVRLSIFDVSDFANPQLLTAEVVGSNGGYSEAIYNPKAFTYFAEAGLLAFPMEIYDWQWQTPVAGGDGADGSVPPPDGDTTDAGTPDATTTDAVAADGGSTDSKGGYDGPTRGVGGTGEGSSEGETPVDIYIPPPLPPDYFRGVYVYQVSVSGGFKLLGRSTGSPAGVEEALYYPDFMRGAFIGATSYTITSDMVKASSLDKVDTAIAEVDFPLPDWYTNGGGIAVDPGIVVEPAPAPADDLSK